MSQLNLPRIAQTLDFSCGASCFDSMYRFFNGSSPGEISFARELGTLDLGYTPPENIVKLARQYGFSSFLLEDADLSLVDEAIKRQEVVFVTWWDEDAGHYSLVKSINDQEIILMDPWEARQAKDKILTISDFYLCWSMRGRKMIRVF